MGDSTGGTNIPDKVTPVLGWRQWSLDRYDRLRSPIYAPRAWMPQMRLEAVCANSALPRGTHVAPNEECRCGVYANNTAEQCVILMPSENALVGQVALWGKVVEHEDGFRAQYAYPVRLYAPVSISRQRQAALSVRYGIPVYPLKELTLSNGAFVALLQKTVRRLVLLQWSLIVTLVAMFVGFTGDLLRAQVALAAVLMALPFLHVAFSKPSKVRATDLLSLMSTLDNHVLKRTLVYLPLAILAVLLLTF